MLPVWAPLVALGVGDGAVALAFSVFHWPATFQPTAILATTLFFGASGIGGLLERARRRRRLAQARSLAVGIECVDGAGLLALIASVRGEVPDTMTAAAMDEPPLCPACARSMVRRHSQRGPFWGCSAFPSCRGIIDIPA